MEMKNSVDLQCVFELSTSVVNRPVLAHFFTGLENLPSSPFLLGCTGNGNKEVVLGTGGKMGKILNTGWEFSLLQHQQRSFGN